MESQQPLDQGFDSQSPLTDMSYQEMRRAGGWALFLSILGSIGIGLMILVGIVLTVTSSSLNQQFGSDFPLPLSFVGVIYIIIGAIYALPLLFLYRFAQNARSAAETHDRMQIEESLSFLRKHFQTMGIIVIAIVGLYIIIFIGMLIAGAGMFGSF